MYEEDKYEIAISYDAMCEQAEKVNKAVEEDFPEISGDLLE